MQGRTDHLPSNKVECDGRTMQIKLLNGFLLSFMLGSDVFKHAQSLTKQEAMQSNAKQRSRAYMAPALFPCAHNHIFYL